MAPVKTIKVPPSSDLTEMVVPVAIEVSLATSVKLDDIPILEKVLEKAVEDVLKRFEKDNFRIFVRTGTVRPMTQDELLSIIPRKVHMALASGLWLCTTPHVSPKNLTQNPDEVTCKLCLKVMEKDAKR